MQVDEAELDAADICGELQLRSVVPGGRPDRTDQFSDACTGAQDDPRRVPSASTGGCNSVVAHRSNRVRTVTRRSAANRS